MKVNWSQNLLDHKNKPIQGADGKPVNFGDFAVMLLLAAQNEQDQKASAEDKYKVYKLGKKIMDTPESDFSVEEIALVKKHVGQKATPWMVGVIFDILEGTNESK